MTGPVKSPLQVKKSATTVLGNVVGIEVSYGHSCAYDTAGAMYCWGDNFYGQLAKDISSVFSSPYALPVGGLVATSGERVVEMGLGEKHSCALLANDSVNCLCGAIINTVSSAAEPSGRVS